MLLHRPLLLLAALLLPLPAAAARKPPPSAFRLGVHAASASLTLQEGASWTPRLSFPGAGDPNGTGLDGLVAGCEVEAHHELGAILSFRFWTTDVQDTGDSGATGSTRAAGAVPYYQYVFRPGRHVRPFAGVHGGMLILWDRWQPGTTTGWDETSTTWVAGLQGGLRWTPLPGGAVDVTPFAERAQRFTQHVTDTHEADLWTFGLSLGVSAWFR
jgi:hypothetical protein